MLSTAVSLITATTLIATEVQERKLRVPAPFESYINEFSVGRMEFKDLSQNGETQAEHFNIRAPFFDFEFGLKYFNFNDVNGFKDKGFYQLYLKDVDGVHRSLLSVVSNASPFLVCTGRYGSADTSPTHYSKNDFNNMARYDESNNSLIRGIAQLFSDPFSAPSWKDLSFNKTSIGFQRLLGLVDENSIIKLRKRNNMSALPIDYLIGEDLSVEAEYTDEIHKRKLLLEKSVPPPSSVNPQSAPLAIQEFLNRNHPLGDPPMFAYPGSGLVVELFKPQLQVLDLHINVVLTPLDDHFIAGEHENGKQFVSFQLWLPKIKTIIYFVKYNHESFPRILVSHWNQIGLVSSTGKTTRWQSVNLASMKQYRSDQSKIDYRADISRHPDRQLMLKFMKSNDGAGSTLKNHGDRANEVIQGSIPPIGWKKVKEMKAILQPAANAVRSKPVR